MHLNRAIDYGTIGPITAALLENVLCVTVTPQVNLPLKGPRTEVTNEGLVARVLTSVCDQI